MVNLPNVCLIFNAIKKLTLLLFTARKCYATSSFSKTKRKSKESEDAKCDEDASKKGQIAKLINTYYVPDIGTLQVKRSIVLSVIPQLSMQMVYLWI